MPKGLRVLITGGGGFIGTALMERLIEDNEVTLFDQHFDKQPLQYSDKKDHPNLKKITGDILDFDIISRAVQDEWNVRMADGCVAVIDQKIAL